MHYISRLFCHAKVNITFILRPSSFKLSEVGVDFLKYRFVFVCGSFKWPQPYSIFFNQFQMYPYFFTAAMFAFMQGDRIWVHEVQTLHYFSAFIIITHRNACIMLTYTFVITRLLVKALLFDNEAWNPLDVKSGRAVTLYTVLMKIDVSRQVLSWHSELGIFSFYFIAELAFSVVDTLILRIYDRVIC